MKIIFCEECGGKNIVEPRQLDNVDAQPLVCQICGNIMSQETIIPHNRIENTIDTLQYHLLFVDDDLFHLQLMKTSLAKEYTVSIASTGKHGLQLAEELNPDLILLDINMPGMDGYEVGRLLKESQKTRHIPVIFVSARDEGEDESKGFLLGAMDFINKPINLQILNARISVQLRFKQLLEQQKKQADSLIKSLNEKKLQEEIEQQNLFQEKNNFAAILDSLQVRVIIEEPEKRIVWANKTALKACNLNLSEVIGKYCHEIMQLGTSVCKKCPFWAMSNNDLSTAVAISSSQSDSQSLQIHLPLFDEEGELKGVAHIFKEEIAAGIISCNIPDKNRMALQNSLSAILFGVDAIGSMYKEDTVLTSSCRSISEAAEQLDSMIHELLDK